MASKRIEKIKKSRSLNELFSVVREIAKEFTAAKPAVDKFIKALSSSQLRSVSEELNIDRVGGGNTTKSPKTTTTKTPTAKVTKWVAPKLEDLKKNTALIHSLYENTEELDYAITMVKQVFSGNENSKKAILEMTKLRDSVDEKLNSCFAVLNAIANKHLPPRVGSLHDDIIQGVIAHLPVKNYKNIVQEIYVIPNPEELGSFMFCLYCNIKNLKNKTGYEYETFCVTLTAIISKSGDMNFFVNAFPNFKVPGRYPIGKEVTDSKDAMRQVDLLLTHNEFEVDLNKQALPFDDAGAKNLGLLSNKNITAVAVKNDELIITLAPGLSGQMTSKVIADIQARLGMLISSKNSKSIFTYKMSTVGGKQVLKFVLLPNIDKSNKNLQINSGKLDELAELLNLTDAQKKAVRFGLLNK